MGASVNARAGLRLYTCNRMSAAVAIEWLAFVEVVSLSSICFLGDLCITPLLQHHLPIQGNGVFAYVSEEYEVSRACLVCSWVSL